MSRITINNINCNTLNWMEPTVNSIYKNTTQLTDWMTKPNSLIPYPSLPIIPSGKANMKIYLIRIFNGKLAGELEISIQNTSYLKFENHTVFVFTVFLVVWRMMARIDLAPVWVKLNSFETGWLAGWLIWLYYINFQLVARHGMAGR